MTCRRWIKLSLLLGTSILSAPAAAQEPVQNSEPAPAPANDSPVETREADANAGESDQATSDIVVTARRRAENVMDVPVSISALSAEMIEERGLTSVNDLGSSVPNVRMPPTNSGSNGSGAYTYGMRGIASNTRNIGFDPGVGAYVDGVFVGRSAAFNQALTDIERIEVLRGPQGTLFGKNTIAGAINIVTRAPSNTLEGSVGVGFGNRDALRANARISGPLAEGVTGKISFSRSVKDGQVRNGFDKTEYLHDDDTSSVRAGLRVEPTSELTLTFGADYTRVRANGTGVQLARIEGVALTVPGTVAGDPEAMNIDGSEGSPLYNWRDEYGVSLTGDLSLGAATVTFISAYRDSRLRFSYDDEGTPWPIQTSIFDDRAKAFSQELRIASAGKRFWDYVAGIYYFDQRATTNRYTVVGFPTRVNRTPFHPVYETFPTQFGRLEIDGSVDTKAWAVFASNDFNFSDALSVTLGGRYTQERKSLDFNQADTSWFGFPSLDIQGQDRKDSDVSGNVSLNFHPTDDVLLYVSAARGFKSGGFNPDYIRASITFGPEKVTSYEAGLKGDFFGKLLRVTSAVFYSNYSDQQVNIFEAGAFTIKNAGKSQIKGAELEVLLRPLAGLNINGSVGYTDAEFKRFPNCLGANTDCAGNRLPYVPKWSAFGAIDYSIPLGTGTISPRLEVSYTSSQFFDAINNPRNKVPAYTLFNGSLAYESDHGWRVSGWVKNVFDKKYDAARWDIASLLGIHYFLPGERRTYGVDLSYSF